MDKDLQNQVLELARLHNLFPLLAQQRMELSPPGLPREALRSLARAETVFQTLGYTLQEEGGRGRLCGPGVLRYPNWPTAAAFPPGEGRAVFFVRPCNMGWFCV